MIEVPHSIGFGSFGSSPRSPHLPCNPKGNLLQQQLWLVSITLPALPPGPGVYLLQEQDPVLHNARTRRAAAGQATPAPAFPAPRQTLAGICHRRECQAPAASRAPAARPLTPAVGPPHETPPAGMNARGWLRRFTPGYEGFLPERAGGSVVQGLRAGAQTATEA